MPPPPSSPRPDLESLLAHTPYVRALARELVFDAALARDVEQETWLAALEQAPRDPSAQRGWLAAIVRNLARKAWRSSARRRTREELHASTPGAVPTPAEVAEREDLRRKLVERVNALEEPYRAALVLRYLEGLEPPAIARRLGVPLETVRTRQKRGLELLRARLDRDRGGREAWCLVLVRGFELGPPSLVKLASVALSASLAGTSGILVMSLAKKAALAAVVLVLGATVYFVSELGEPAGPEGRGEIAGELASVPASAAEATAPPISAPVALAAERVGVAPVAALAPDDGDLVHVSGRALGPDGNPLAGAEIFLTRWYWDERLPPKDPLAVTRADDEGHWSLMYSKSDPRFAVDAERPEMWRYVTVSAFAPGFGPDWQALKELPAGEEVVLSLVHDAPLQGRLLDLEGRPVEGVSVRVMSVEAFEGESLDGFLRDPSKADGAKRKYLQLPPGHELACATGPDGRFELSGIGRERLVRLDLRGDTITQAYLSVATRTIEPIPHDETGQAAAMGSVKPVRLGSGFDWVVRPTRPITGLVRDAASGKPMADVVVRSLSMSGVPHLTGAVETTTDASGRFRLLGLPKGAGNQILVMPNDEQPYFMKEVEVPDPAGMAAVEVEVELLRGSFATGRVTDRATGKPVYGRIHYLPFLDNPYAQKLFGDGDVPSVPGAFAEQRRYKTDADGRFRIVVAPGRAILGVNTIVPYRQGAGSEAIEGMNEDGEFATFEAPLPASRRWPTSMRLIDPPEGAQAITCDLELDPGKTLELTLVDPQGEPVEHCSVAGAGGRSYSGTALDAGPVLRVTTLGPGEQRLLRIHQPERELALAAFVSLDMENDEEKRVLKLAPCTTLVGRLLDQGGAPVGGVEVEPQTMINFDRLPSVQTDAEGRFRFEHVASGVPFTLAVKSSVLEDTMQAIARDFVVEPGATMDLGDVRVKVR